MASMGFCGIRRKKGKERACLTSTGGGALPCSVFFLPIDRVHLASYQRQQFFIGDLPRILRNRRSDPSPNSAQDFFKEPKILQDVEKHGGGSEKTPVSVSIPAGSG